MKKAMLFIAMLASIHSQSATASYITNKDFAAFTEEQKHWWYSGTFTNLGHVAAIHDGQKMADCIWRWYFDNIDRRKAQLEKSYVKYPEHTPSAVIISLLKRDCDAFKSGN